MRQRDKIVTNREESGLSDGRRDAIRLSLSVTFEFGFLGEVRLRHLQRVFFVHLIFACAWNISGEPRPLWAAPPRRTAPPVSRRNQPDLIDWSLAACPVTGDPVDPALTQTLLDGWIAFSSDSAQREFRAHRSDYLLEAHQQLVQTGQFRQKTCPQTGRRQSPWNYLPVDGYDIQFADVQARNEFLKLSESDRLQRVFGAKAFARHFEFVPLEERPVSSERLKVALLRPEGDPRTEAEVAVIERRLAPAMQAQDRNWDRLMAPAGVVGHTASLDDNGKPIIRLLLKRVTDKQKLPTEVDGIAVIPESVGEFFATQQSGGDGPLPDDGIDWHGATSGNPRWVNRPVPIGVSFGVSYPGGTCNGGTIACRLTGVLPDGTPALFLLSCNHVVAGVNQAPIDSPLLQPAKVDNGCLEDPEDYIGTLQMYRVLQLGGLANRVDAGLVRTTESNAGNATPADGYGLPKSQPLTATVGMLVQKYGRTTTRTYGRVTGVNSTIVIAYPAGNVLFTGQLTVSNRAPSTVFTRPGDSGALVVTDPGREPVGLLIAGNSTGTVGILNRIQEVLDAFSSLQVAIDGE